MFREEFKLPVVVGDIKSDEVMFRQWQGSQLIYTLFDGENNIIARGTGMNWNENYQMNGDNEWGRRHVIEIVDGAMGLGQISIQTMYFFHLNNNLPTYRSLGRKGELTGIVQVRDHELPQYKGLVLDVFEGVKIAGLSGNWSANTKYLMQIQSVYRIRKNAIEWLDENPDLASQTDEHAPYPAAVGQ